MRAAITVKTLLIQEKSKRESKRGEAPLKKKLPLPLIKGKGIKGIGLPNKQSQTVRRYITRSLGLDIGDKRIGVALSDPQGILASPFTIINRKDERLDIEAINNIISQKQVEQIIVGLPRSMDGSIGKQAEKVKDFVQRLCSHTEVPVEFRDERLSTVSAKRLMQDINTKKTRKKVRDDAIAAALILQGYLDENPTGV